MSNDSECLALLRLEAGLGHDGAAELILATARLHLIEAHGGEQIPCRHLSHVLIACQAVLAGAILAIHYLAQNLLRLVGTSGVVV